MVQYSHLAANILHSSRKEKNAPKVSQRSSGFSHLSQAQKLPSLVSARLPQASAMRHGGCKLLCGQGQRGGVMSLKTMQWCCHYSGSGGQNIKPKRIILKLKNLMEVSLLGFIFSGICHPILLFNFFLSEWECLSYASLTAVFLEARNWSSFMGSQLEGILPQDKSYLESHAYVITRYLDETLYLELMPEWVKTFGAAEVGVPAFCI